MSFNNEFQRFKKPSNKSRKGKNVKFMSKQNLKRKHKYNDK